MSPFGTNALPSRFLSIEHGVDLPLVGALNRRGMIWDEEGIVPHRVAEQLSDTLHC